MIQIKYNRKLFWTILLFGLILISGCSTKKQLNVEINQDLQKIEKFRQISTGSIGDQDVMVDLKPINITNNEIEFEFFMNTHSIDLAKYDLLNSTRLKINDDILKPNYATRLSGHHPKGKLVFIHEFNIEEITNFTVTIEGIPNVSVRTYSWTL